MSNIHEKLLTIQQKLKVEKSQYNKVGGFSYRSKEDILEALKPLCKDTNCVVICDDSVYAASETYIYIETVAKLIDCETGESLETSGFAREPEKKKGMDTSQITGTASSYAGKRALGNLFAIDDTADADTYEPEPTQPPQDRPFVAHCKTCGARYQFNPGTTLEAMNQIQCCANPNYEVEQ